MKGILITESNRAMLMARYNSSDPDEFPIGYILVANFGDNGMEPERYEGLLTQAFFDQTFTRGEDLQNGYFAINRK